MHFAENGSITLQYYLGQTECSICAVFFLLLIHPVHIPKASEVRPLLSDNVVTESNDLHIMKISVDPEEIKSAMVRKASPRDFISQNNNSGEETV